MLWLHSWREVVDVPKDGATRANGVHSLVLAGFWHRVAAGIVDLLLAGPVAVAVFAAWVVFVHVRLPRWSGIWWDWLLQVPHMGDPYVAPGLVLAAVAAVSGLCYASVLWQASPGQRLLGLMVVDPSGKPPGWGRWTARSAFLLVSFGYLLLGVLWIGFDRLRQGWHDKLAGTYVVRHRG